MKHNALIYFLALLLLSCASNKTAADKGPTTNASVVKYPKPNVINQKHLRFNNIPSASGIEYYSNTYHIIGDDAPFVYVLDTTFQQIAHHPLFDSSSFINGRIPSQLKADLESLTLFKYGRKDLMLALGSGSGKARNKAYIFEADTYKVTREVDLTQFYYFLQQILYADASPSRLLNIEGLAMDDHYVYLLQRALGKASNFIFRTDRAAFVDFLLQDGPMPAVAVFYFSLPSISGKQAGFSGAYILGDRLFFTASVEDTQHAQVDGEVLGSFAGYFELQHLKFAMKSQTPFKLTATQILDAEQRPYKGKAESLVVRDTGQEGRWLIILVSDDDQGGSDLLELDFMLND